MIRPAYPKWEVRSFYGKYGQPELPVGVMNLHTWNGDDLSKDMEVAACLSRKEIGYVEVKERYNDNNRGWNVVFDENSSDPVLRLRKP